MNTEPYSIFGPPLMQWLLSDHCLSKVFRLHFTKPGQPGQQPLNPVFHDVHDVLSGTTVPPHVFTSEPCFKDHPSFNSPTALATMATHQWPPVGGWKPCARNATRASSASRRDGTPGGGRATSKGMALVWLLTRSKRWGWFIPSYFK